MRTKEKQIELLVELIAVAKARGKDGERDWLEFKTNISESHASITYERVGCYLSGLSNSACLKYRDHGYLVLGVEDGSWNIVGTNLLMLETKIGQQDYELWLRKNLDPILNFEIEEFDYAPGKHIVIFEVPATHGVPVAFKNEAYVRPLFEVIVCLWCGGDSYIGGSIVECATTADSTVVGVVGSNADGVLVDGK